MMIILNVVFAVIENILVIMYLNLFLKKKGKYENRIFIDIIFIVLLTVILLVVDYFLRILSNGLILMVLLIGYANYIYEGNIYNKILKIILININMILINGICIFLLSTTTYYQELYYDNYFNYSLGLFIKIVWLIEYFYLKKYYTGEFKLSKRVWGYIVFVLILIIGLVIIISNELLLAHIPLITALYTYVVSLLVVILIYYVCLKMTEYYNKVIDQKVNLESLKYENTIVEVATKKSEEYNKILHDYKHLVGVLKDIEVNEKVKQDILSNIDLKETRELIHTNHVVFNYVMNNVTARAYELGIDFHGTYPKNIGEGISSYDLLILLSNLFDNAIEASCQAGRKEIKYKIICNEYNLVIRIENTFDEERFNNFNTTKTDKSKHGHGLYKIKEIIKKYDGEDILKKKDDVILHSCLINLKNK